MTLEIKIPDKLAQKMPEEVLENFRGFLQLLANRRAHGWAQYERHRFGRPERRQRYARRLKREVRVYDKTGNFEHLLNVAVYCHLESEAPENPRFHFEANVDSVTREDFGT